MRKILVPVLSRANYGRLKSVLKAINEHPSLELQLIVGCSALLEKYGCIKEIEADGFTITDKVYGVVEGDNPSCMADTVGILVPKFTQIYSKLKPDLVFIHADRYEMLAPTIAASYSNITVAHNQAGEVSGTIDDKVRNSITTLSDIYFTSTRASAECIFHLKGYDWDDCPSNSDIERIYNVGCPSIDLIANMDLSITEDFNKKYPSVGCEIDYDKPYIVVIQHPNTQEYGSSAWQIRQTIEAVKKMDAQIVWFWSNIDAGSDDITKELRKWREEGAENVRFIKNMSPEDYYKLINNAICLVGNTSSGIREGSYLGVPYVCIGTRQNNREHARNTIFVGYNANKIKDAYVKHRAKSLPNGKYPQSTLFGNGTAGKQIADILGRLT